jgi:8-oxo-dGTP diphosphatase
MDIRLAGCIITDSDGRILLLHRNTPERTQWEIPGGKVDDGETPEDTAVRELDEELGVRVTLTRDLGSMGFDEDGHTMEYSWFLADITSGEPTIREPDLYDWFRYFSPNELRVMYLKLSPNTQNFLGEITAGRITI